jgi:succinoglycan biosynthesis protein ExoV
MKLFYYNGKQQSIKMSNFGDDLNPWVWNRLIPNLLDDNEKTIFVGIGTLLNEHLPLSKKIIFGSGVGYGTPPQIDNSWHLYFVRGQLSAKALEISMDFALTDPAILVRYLYQASGEKFYKAAYMPHFTEAVYNGQAWQELCQNLNIHYIDPTAPVEQVLLEIARSEVLYTEAMHGAIVADALRVPWVAVKTKADILEFKWNDWLSSLQVPYQPFYLKRFMSLLSQKNLPRFCDYQFTRSQLVRMIRTTKPSLSSLSTSNDLAEQVKVKVENLKSDVSQGLFT